MSTLHTNTAVGAVTRLRDMGVEPFLLSSSLVGVLAQRLVRMLCKDCRTTAEPTERERSILGLESSDRSPIFKPVGCKECGGSGFRGRTGIYELISLNDSMRTMIHDGASEQELEAYARKMGPGIRDDGRFKVLAGDTTVEEVLRVTQED